MLPYRVGLGSGNEFPYMAKKLTRYIPEVKAGLPPDRLERLYNAKIGDGVLMEIADRIEPGHYIENLAQGSAGKFADRVRLRGLEVVRRRSGNGLREDVYVVTNDWLRDHPNVGYAR